MTELVTTGGAPVTTAPDQGRIVTGGPVHARVLVTHDHPSCASTFEVTIAPGFDVGAHVHTNGEEMFYVIHGHIDVLCFEPVDRSTGDWHQWVSPTGQSFLRGGRQVGQTDDLSQHFRRRPQGPGRLQSRLEAGRRVLLRAARLSLRAVAPGHRGQPNVPRLRGVRRHDGLRDDKPATRVRATKGIERRIDQSVSANARRDARRPR